MRAIERATEAIKAARDKAGGFSADDGELARAAVLAFLEGMDADDIGGALAPSFDEAAAIEWGARARKILAALRAEAGGKP